MTVFGRFGLKKSSPAGINPIQVHCMWLQLTSGARATKRSYNLATILSLVCWILWRAYSFIHSWELIYLAFNIHQGCLLRGPLNNPHLKIWTFQLNQCFKSNKIKWWSSDGSNNGIGTVDWHEKNNRIHYCVA